MITPVKFRKLLKEIGATELTSFSQFGSIFSTQIQMRVLGADFQISKYGGEFVVNLGFHYSYFPSFLTFQHKPHNEFELLDFALVSRLGKKGAGEIWYQFGETTAECEIEIRKAMKHAVATLHETTSAWDNPAWFTDILSPDKVRKYSIELSTGTFPKDRAELHEILARRRQICGDAVIEFFDTWGLDFYKVVFFSAMIASQLGDKALALEYLDILSTVPPQAEAFTNAIKKLKDYL